MTPPPAGPAKTLVVGPIGDRPWITSAELEAQLTALGHEVVVNMGPDRLAIPYPDPLPARVGAADNFLPRVVLWLFAMLRRWRSVARQALIDGRFTYVLVWDPVLAALYRFARPPGVELVWVLPPPEGQRVYQRLMRFLTVLAADRVVVSSPGESAVDASRETLVPPSTVAPASLQLESWVVLGSERAPAPSALAALEERASTRPAAAVLFNSRDHDRMTPEAAEAIRSASGASVVWWAGGDEWIGWLGGVPSEAVDPSSALVPDHRHRSVLAHGAQLLAAAESVTGPWIHLLEGRGDRVDGFTQFGFRGGLGSGVVDGEWSAAAFPPPRSDLIRDHSVPVSACLLCNGLGRQIVAETDAGTFIVRCARCGLYRASHVVPVELANQVRSVEPRPLAGRAMIERLGLRSHRVLELDDIDRVLPGHRFDVVLVAGALLRSADPVRTLRAVRERLLESDGHVIVEVPNVRSLSRRFHGGRWGKWKPGELHWYADAWALRQVLHRSGFEVVALHSDSARARRGLSSVVDRLGYGRNIVAAGRAR